MAEDTIPVGRVSDGPDEGEEVTLPVIDVLTGRLFVTGKSGSGKSNTASVVAEQLLDRGYALLIVDIDGEYYGLKEKYEILHVGADDECDIQVGPEHAEKIADLALENNIPIILDISSYLDESKAADILTSVARQLFAKEKKLKKPFLLVVEEVHEFIPEGGSIDECGRMLIKIGKRGRKHGLGIAGISQRPADVKKDFITQCDWLCWHRLTWKNDTKVVRRVLDSEYADAVETLDDGEAFVRADWSDAIQRVQFDRKQTFDAGATPGLDDFERPDLKSVSNDLVGELQQITEEERRREDELEQLRQELAERDEHIARIERDLAEARDLSRMADQFAAAMFDHTGRSRAQLETEQQTLEENPGLQFPIENDAHATNGDGQTAPSVESTTSSADESDAHDHGSFPDRPQIDTLREEFRQLDDVARAMLARYRADGPLSPVDAHVAAGGTSDRTTAYARNSTLRRVGLVVHVGRGQYDYALPHLVAATYDGHLPDEEAETIVERVEDDLFPVE